MIWVCCFLSLESGALVQRRPGTGGAALSYLPVAHVFRAGVVDLDDDKHVLEVRADVFGSKWKGPGFLEHDGDDVVADVALPQQL